jgi:hypothetical protein
MQQWQQLCANGIVAPNPQKQMLMDLAAFLTPYETNGHEILVMINVNAPANKHAVEQFLDKLNLHDLMAPFLPDDAPSMYQQG